MSSNIPSDSQSDLLKFQNFLNAEKAEPPTRKKAKAVWNKFIAILDSLVGDKDNQQRFLDLHEKKSKPISTVRPGSAAAYPADHAFNLLERINELDRAWYRRYWGRILQLGGGGGVGAGIKWLVENFDPRWIGFCIAGLIGYLVMDDVYDGGSVLSFAITGLLAGILLQLPDRKSRRKVFDRVPVASDERSDPDTRSEKSAT
jgi:hypothetical protein